jgi:hypothetical protein
MDYELIAVKDTEKLDDAVKKKLADGWELYGSPSICGVVLNPGSATPKTDYTYIQAVVKKDKPKFQNG